jgi:hypothetical protein
MAGASDHLFEYQATAEGDWVVLDGPHVPSDLAFRGSMWLGAAGLRWPLAAS